MESALMEGRVWEEDRRVENQDAAQAFERMMEDLRTRQPSTAREVAEHRWQAMCTPRQLDLRVMSDKAQRLHKPPLVEPVKVDRVVQLSAARSLRIINQRGLGLLLKIEPYCNVSDLTIAERRIWAKARRDAVNDSRFLTGMFAYNY
jgi:hypothetical protein